MTLVSRFVDSGVRNVPQSSKNEAFDKTIFERTSADFTRLQNRLPKDAVEGLAEEVVHRLSQRADSFAFHAHALPDDEVDALAHALISYDENAAANLISAVQRDGASMEVIYLSYLASAARRLGVWWEDDRITFVDVTIGAGRIYAIMRAMRRAFLVPTAQEERMAMFALVPGDTHTLGIAMAADLFRQRGWEISVVVGKSHNELIEIAERSPCRIFGLSASSVSPSVNVLTRLIVGLRMVAPEAGILVSGGVVEQEPDVMHLVGADFATTDMHEAFMALEKMSEEMRLAQ